MLTEKFDKEKYDTAEITMSAKKSNSLMFLFLLPFYIIEVCVYLLNKDMENIFTTLFKETFLFEMLVLAFGIFLFVVVSMLAKAIFLSIFSEGGFANVKFKIIKESQKLHCCLKEPVTIGQYKFCLAVYILILAVLPYVAALIIGDFMFVLASFICMFFAGGDILFFISLFGWKKYLNAPGDLYVLDFDGIMLYRLYFEKQEK